MDNFHGKLAEIQQELKVPKNQYNSFGKYKFRNCEDILEALKPVLHKHGLYVTLSDSVEPCGDFVFVVATATVTDGEHSVSSKGYAMHEATKKGMDGSQLTGATSSYARKYALNGLFGIDDTKDADTTNKHGKDDVKKENVQKQQKAPNKQEKKQPTSAQIIKKAKDALSKEGNVEGLEAVWNGKIVPYMQGFDTKVKDEAQQIFNDIRNEMLGNVG